MDEKNFVKNFKVEELDNSVILVAKKEFVVPEKKIVFLNENNGAEKQMIKNIGYTGGIIL